VTTPSDREIVMTRVFDAPRERVFDAPRDLVWRAWTETERIKRWWGPKDFTAPAVNIDLRVGGAWLHAMQSADFNDGKPIWSTGVFREIVEPERIVMTDSFADEQGNIVPASHYGMDGDFPDQMLITVVFEDLGDRTKMTLRHEGLPAGEHLTGANIGWNQSLDKLAESLQA
jgi:uncharacterized protein YndB with AHSA1/START domain